MRAWRLPCGNSTCEPGNDTNSPRATANPAFLAMPGRPVQRPRPQRRWGRRGGPRRGGVIAARGHDHLERRITHLCGHRANRSLDRRGVVPGDHDRRERRRVPADRREVERCPPPFMGVREQWQALGPPTPLTAGPSLPRQVRVARLPLSAGSASSYLRARASRRAGVLPPKCWIRSSCGLGPQARSNGAPARDGGGFRGVTDGACSKSR